MRFSHLFSAVIGATITAAFFIFTAPDLEQSVTSDAVQSKQPVNSIRSIIENNNSAAESTEAASSLAANTVAEVNNVSAAKTQEYEDLKTELEQVRDENKSLTTNLTKAFAIIQSLQSGDDANEPVEPKFTDEELDEYYQEPIFAAHHKRSQKGLRKSLDDFLLQPEDEVATFDMRQKVEDFIITHENGSEVQISQLDCRASGCTLLLTVVPDDHRSWTRVFNDMVQTDWFMSFSHTTSTINNDEGIFVGVFISWKSFPKV